MIGSKLPDLESYCRMSEREMVSGDVCLLVLAGMLVPPSWV